MTCFENRSIPGSPSMLITSSTLNITTSESKASIAKYKLAGFAVAAAHPDSCEHKNETPDYLYSQSQVIQDTMDAVRDWEARLSTTPTPQRILYIEGRGTSAMTTLAYTYCRALRAKGSLAGAFFFKQGDPQRGHGKGFAASLAYQIWRSIPELGPFIEEIIDDHPLVLSSSLKDQLQNLVVLPFKRLLGTGSKIEKMIIVVDSLDECEDPQEQALILDWITTDFLGLNAPLGVFVTAKAQGIVARRIHKSYSAKAIQFKDVGSKNSSIIDSTIDFRKSNLENTSDVLSTRLEAASNIAFLSSYMQPSRPMPVPLATPPCPCSACAQKQPANLVWWIQWHNFKYQISWAALTLKSPFWLVVGIFLSIIAARLPLSKHRKYRLHLLEMTLSLLFIQVSNDPIPAWHNFDDYNTQVESRPLTGLALYPPSSQNRQPRHLGKPPTLRANGPLRKSHTHKTRQIHDPIHKPGLGRGYRTRNDSRVPRGRA